MGGRRWETRESGATRWRGAGGWRARTGGGLEVGGTVLCAGWMGMWMHVDGGRDDAWGEESGVGLGGVFWHEPLVLEEREGSVVGFGERGGLCGDWWLVFPAR